MKVTEFYPEKQGRPISRTATSIEGRGDGSLIGIPPYSVRGIQLAGEFSRTTKTDDYTAGDEMVILVDASSIAVDITLPEASTNSSKIYYIKKIDNTSNSVTIKGDSLEETIDGEVEIVLNLQYQYVMIICDSLDWFILGGEYVKMVDILLQTRSVEEANKELLKKILKELEKLNS